MSVYQYERLLDPRGQIRVAVIEPGVYDDEIHISFRIRSFEGGGTSMSTTESFDYEALSYAWGSRDYTSHVLVKDSGLVHGQIRIAHNLNTAIQHLRHQHETRLIWIDAICIDQSNEQEKSTQVSTMGKIFATASSVTAWLGPEKNDSSAALSLLQYLGRQIEVDWQDKTMRPSDKSDSPDWANINIQLSYQAGELDSVSALLEQPYFDRLWIRQEIVLAKVAYAQCGQQQIPWEDFRKAIFMLVFKRWLRKAVNDSVYQNYDTKVTIVWDLCRLVPSTLQLEYIRYNLRDTECENSRDRLYAILSLLNKKGQRLCIDPDYTREAEDVYTQTVRRYVDTHTNLNLLLTCELSSKKLDIPSWVPDWSNRLTTDSPVNSVWSACGWISARTIFMDNDRLRASGLKVAEVETIEPIAYTRGQTEDKRLQILRKLKPLSGFEDSKDNRRLEILDTYCQALLHTFAETFLPPRTALVSLSDCSKFLEKVWSTDANMKGIESLTSVDARQCLKILTAYLAGRCFIHASNGYLGLAPTETQRGDIICILLGCRWPVILRPLTGSDFVRIWQVVGICQVPGLMNGELIYRNHFSIKYRPVSPLGRSHDLIDGWRFAMYNAESGDLKRNPAEMLEETGIKVERYQREPYLLEVLPESLRAARLPLEDFTIV